MNSKERFTNRVEAYAKYRPSYPSEAVQHLYEVVGLSEASVVADIGAGTGIFSRLLLDHGSQVIAVEPNDAMRLRAEQLLGGVPRFRAVSGAAEETGLADHAVDYIVCAQSFHWFDRARAQHEFRRILKPGGQAILIWNARKITGTPFLADYEQLHLDYGIDYVAVRHRNIEPDRLRTFFQEGTMHEARFALKQSFDYEGLCGRMISSSYSPPPGHPSHEPMLKELRKLFERHAVHGEVDIAYETELFWGSV